MGIKLEDLLAKGYKLQTHLEATGTTPDRELSAGDNAALVNSEAASPFSARPVRLHSPSHEHPTASQLPDPEPQCPDPSALVATTARETQGGTRIVVRFISYRTRTLDSDNLAGGSKFLLDCLRYAGLIPGDEPDKIIFVSEQVKVAHRQDERTEIELTDEKTRGMQ